MSRRFDDSRDRKGRFQPGAPSPNPRGRQRKASGVDAALLNALSEKVVVTEGGRRARRSKLDVTTAQLANKGASGDLRATKLLLENARRAEERAAAAIPLEIATSETDREIVNRVIERLASFLPRKEVGHE